MGTQKKLEIRFTEEMKGYQQAGPSRPSNGRGDGQPAEPRIPARFVVTVTVPDLQALLADPGTPCILTGMFYGCYASGQEWSAPILDGVFHLFAGNTETGPARMEYRFACADPTRGASVSLKGYKDIARRSPLHVWRDTTTLFCEWRDAGGEGAIVSTGILRIYPLAFLKQLTTFRTSADGAMAGALALVRFFALFARVLWNIYGLRLPGASTDRPGDRRASTGNSAGGRP